MHANQVMEPNELDITVLCGPFKSEDDDLCLFAEAPTDHCAVTAMAAGKSENCCFLNFLNFNLIACV